MAWLCEPQVSKAHPFLKGLSISGGLPLCWVRAVSGPLLGKQFISTYHGFTMGFCQWAELGSKVGFWV